MARLSEMTAAFASTLRVPAPSVNLTARHLREAGMISQGGRGRGGAQMTPRDATNLLLGVMGPETIQQAPERVRFLRQATHAGSDSYQNVDSSDEVPAFPFLDRCEVGAITLGQALENLIEEAMVGDPEAQDGLPITNLRFSVARPDLYSFFELDTGDDVWCVRFRRDDPRLDGLEGVERIRAAERLFRNERRGMETQTQVSLDHFHAIADVLADRT